MWCKDLTECLTASEVKEAVKEAEQRCFAVRNIMKVVYIKNWFDCILEFKQVGRTSSWNITKVDS